MNGKSLKSKVQGLKSKASRRNAATGFTLIELLVAMGILMMIVLMLANLFQQSTRAWNAGLHQTALGLEARAVINMIQRDVSMALPDTISDGSSLSFDMIRNDGEVETVTYTFSDSTSTISRNGRVLVGNVSNFEVEAIAVDPPDDPAVDMLKIELQLVGETRVGGVRVFADGHGWHQQDDPGEIVDTERDL